MDDWRDPLAEIGRTLKSRFSGPDKGESDTSSTDVEPDPTEFLRLIEEGDYYRIRAGDLPARQYGTIKKVRGISTLVFDPENIPRDVLLEAREVFNRTYEDLNGFALEGRGSIAAAIKDESQGDLFNQIYDYYEYKIPRRFLPVLEDAITLRIVEREENISQGELYDWRGEIADNHRNRTHDPQEAQNLVSLCSAGYLDKGEFFRAIYEEFVEDGSWSPDKYKNVFSRFVQDKPFVVFVRSNDMDYSDVYTLAFDKSLKINKYPTSPEFIDICGKGEGPKETVERTIGKFQDEHPDFEYKGIQLPERDQFIARIDTSSL